MIKPFKVDFIDKDTMKVVEGSSNVYTMVIEEEDGMYIKAFLVDESPEVDKELEIQVRL